MVANLAQNTISSNAGSKESVDSVSLTALIVDDEPTNRSILEAILAREGYRTVLAENGRQAVEIFEHERPDIVLMDVMMPEMDGYEATRQIKSASTDHYVPVIFITAIRDEAALAKCVECGGDDFLTKPFSRTILKAKMDASIRMRQLYEALNASKNELDYHHQRMVREQEFAEKILIKFTRPASLKISNIKYLMFPASLLRNYRRPDRRSPHR